MGYKIYSRAGYLMGEELTEAEALRLLSILSWGFMTFEDGAFGVIRAYRRDGVTEVLRDSRMGRIS